MDDVDVVILQERTTRVPWRNLLISKSEGPVVDSLPQTLKLNVFGVEALFILYLRR